MKKTTKAVLLSALIFPGAGHIFLKRYTSASLLAAVSFGALYVIVSNAVDRALDIVDKIQRAELQPDITAITTVLSKQPLGADAQTINMATLVLIVVWLVAVADSYRAGRLQLRNTGH